MVTTCSKEGSFHPTLPTAFLCPAIHRHSAGTVAEITHLLELRGHSSELLAAREAVRMAEFFFFFKGYKSFWKQEALVK